MKIGKENSRMVAYVLTLVGIVFLYIPYWQGPFLFGQLFLQSPAIVLLMSLNGPMWKGEDYKVATRLTHRYASWFGEFHRHNSCLDKTHEFAHCIPRFWGNEVANKDIWAHILFSAWSKTIECSWSMTQSVTSSPRCAGKQCMKRHPSSIPETISSLT